MAARASQYAESLGSSSDTGATYLTKTSVTFTPDASSDYLILWSALIQNVTNLTADAKVRMQNTTDTVTYNEQNIEMKDLTDWTAVHGAAVYTSGGSPGSTTFAVQFAEESAATINIKEARLLMIKLDADDEFVYTAGTTSILGDDTNFADGQTLTFTPGSTGDYLIIASCDHQNAADGDPYTVEGLTSASAEISIADGRVAKDFTNWHGYATMWRETSLSGSKTFKLRFKNDVGLGDDIALRNRCIVALRLDKFDNAYYSETRGRSTSTSTTYQDGATLTQTTSALAYAILACGLYDGSSTTVSSQMKLDKDGGAAKTETLQEMMAAGQGMPWFHVERETLTAASHTWKVQAKSETTSTTTGRYDMAIAVLQLDATPAGGAPALPPGGPREVLQAVNRAAVI